jgi:hypothetical protein
MRGSIQIASRFIQHGIGAAAVRKGSVWTGCGNSILSTDDKTKSYKLVLHIRASPSSLQNRPEPRRGMRTYPLVADHSR